MNRRFIKFIFCLCASTLIVACAVGNTLIAPTPIPITPTRIPETASLATSAAPPFVLPTLAFPSTLFPTPTSIPTMPGGNPFHLVAEIDDIIPNSQSAYLQAAQDGTVWLLTDKGIARVSDSGWTVYLSSYEGDLVGMDNTNRAWIVSVAGDSVSAWDGTKWTKYSSESGWTTANNNTSRFTELSGKIWLITDIDARIFDGAKWKVISPEEMGITIITPCPTEPAQGADSLPFPSFTIKVKAVQSTGEVWVGQCDHQSSDGGQGVRWFDGNTWQGKSTPVGSGCISVIQEDSKGNMWIGMSIGVNKGLWRYDRKTHEWTQIKLPETFQFRSFDNLAFDQTDDIWMLTLGCGGAACFQTLYHLQEDVWQISVYDDPIYQPQDILIDRAGHTWLAGTRGIYRIVDNKTQFATNTVTLNLLVQFDAFDWTMDSAGRIWIVEDNYFRPDGLENKVSLWVATP